MKIAALIFSRSNSTRLNNKPFVKIKNKLLLEVVVERAKLIKDVDKVILATSNQNNDKELIEIAKTNNIKYFAGDLNNVISRAAECCRYHDIDAFVRICGDRPLFDIQLIEKAISIFKNDNTNIDLLSTEIDFRSIPGLVTELISFKAINNLNQNLTSDLDKEHITKYIYNNLDSFNVVKLFSDYKFNGNKLTIDYPEDIDKINYLYTNLNISELLDTKKIIYKLNQWSKINEKNK